jgi:uncharacterized membrane protein HdeD (DUF308 family)
MTNGSVSSPALAPMPVLGDLAHNWGWLLAQGILLVVLGTIGLGLTFWLTLATVFIFGVFLVIGGVIQIVQSFACKGWGSMLWHLLIAVLYVLVGLDIMADPLGASFILTILIGGALVGIGVVRILMAWQLRGLKAWGWPLVGGIAAIILGFMIISKWPVSGFWVIGLFVAIEMIFSGWSYIIISLGIRQLGASPPASA